MSLIEENALPDDWYGFRVGLSAAFAAHCAAVAIVVAFSQPRADPERRYRLAAIFGIVALLALSDPLNALRAFRQWPSLAGLFGGLALLPAPAVFLFIRAMVRPGEPTKALVWAIHLAPALVFGCLMSAVYVLRAQPGTDTVSVDAGELLTFKRLHLAFVSVQIGAYLIASAALLRRFDRELRAWISTISVHTRARLKFMVAMLVLPWIALVVELAIGAVASLELGSRMLGGVVRMATIYALGIAAIRTPELLLRSGDEEEAHAQASRYERSMLAPADMEVIVGRLEATMRDGHAYRDPLLTLGKLAARSRTNGHHLSQVLNRRLGTTFFAYVNQWRVEEAMTLLAADRDRTVIDVGFSVGFSAKSTFNRAFKQATGKSPAAWRAGLGDATE